MYMGERVQAARGLSESSVNQGGTLKGMLKDFRIRLEQLFH